MSLPPLPVPSIAVRQYLYGVACVVLVGLLTYRIIDPTGVPLLLALFSTAFGVTATGTATVAVTKQRNARRRPHRQLGQPGDDRAP